MDAGEISLWTYGLGIAHELRISSDEVNTLISHDATVPTQSLVLRGHMSRLKPVSQSDHVEQAWGELPLLRLHNEAISVATD